MSALRGLFFCVMICGASSVVAEETATEKPAAQISQKDMKPKKFYELTESDLRNHPVWALALDVLSSEDVDLDGDTALVLPLPAEGNIRETIIKDLILYVRVTFTAKDGTKFTGMMKSNEGTGVEQTQPAIITDDGLVDFYHGYGTPPASEIQERYTALGIKPDQLFPLKYEADVKFLSRATGGTLEGVYFVDEDKKVKAVK